MVVSILSHAVNEPGVSGDGDINHTGHTGNVSSIVRNDSEVFHVSVTANGETDMQLPDGAGTGKTITDVKTAIAA